MVGASLSESLWQPNRVLAQAALEHPFIRGIAAGELPRARFAYYVALLRIDPTSVPQPVDNKPDLVTVDTTWGELQPLQCAPGVLTVGELELIEHLRAGAALVDTRVADSRKGVTIPGAVRHPPRRDRAAPRRT